jgi:cytochrome c oxidase cbb3-type subunit III
VTRTTRGLVPLSLAAAVLLGGVGCEKMQRKLHETAPAASLPQVRPGGALHAGVQPPPPPVRNPYEGNSYAMSEGQRLFEWYNCAGCHFRGGGGIGPALMDDVWIYGKEPADIYDTIVQGRPNGMPAWRGKIPDYQVWQLVTYVQALRADRDIAAPPGPRQEHLQAGEGKLSR